VQTLQRLAWLVFPVRLTKTPAYINDGALNHSTYYKGNYHQSDSCASAGCPKSKAKLVKDMDITGVKIIINNHLLAFVKLTLGLILF
jgi:hypothetical protein